MTHFSPRSVPVCLRIKSPFACFTQPKFNAISLNPVSYNALTFNAVKRMFLSLSPFRPIKTIHLTALVEQDENEFYAYCPDLKGCHTQGETMKETLANLQEAASLYLETLTEQEAALLKD